MPETALRGGKRIRPRLIYECCLTLGRPPEEAVTLAAVTVGLAFAALWTTEWIVRRRVRRDET